MSTKEVGNVISALPFVEDANVYGVEVPRKSLCQYKTYLFLDFLNTLTYFLHIFCCQITTSHINLRELHSAIFSYLGEINSFNNDR